MTDYNKQLNKKCNWCDESKPISEYHKDSSKKDGYRGVCKTCWNEKKKKHNKTYHEKHFKLKPKMTYKKWIKSIKKLTACVKTCRLCGKRYIHGYSFAFCSERCKDKGRSETWTKANKVQRDKGNRRKYRRTIEYKAKKRLEDQGRRVRLKTDKDERKRISEWIAKIIKRGWFICYYCNNRHKKSNLHIDHVTPLSKGGLNTLDNLVTSCSKCNLQKGNKDLKDIELSNTRQGVLL